MIGCFRFAAYPQMNRMNDVQKNKGPCFLDIIIYVHKWIEKIVLAKKGKMMKNLKPLSLLALGGLFIFSLGCNSLGNGVGQDEQAAIVETELAKEATVSFEMESHDAIGDSIEFKDAVFSLGWGKFYNPFDEAIQDRSDAFAIAPDTTNQTFGFRRRFGGKDMGTVTLDYGSGSIELLKVEMRNGGVFYNYGKRKPGNPRGMMHGDNGEVSESIPFIPGQTYRFDATGSTDFSAVSVEITAPAAALQISSPVADTEIDASSLEVVWQGGNANDALLISLVPLIDRGSFERDYTDGQGGPGGNGHGHGGSGHGHGHGGPGGGQGGSGGQGFGGRFSDEPGQGGPGMNPHLHLRYLVEDNTGSFTVPAEDLQSLLALNGAKGVLVQVHQMVKGNVDNGGAGYAIMLRYGDAVKLSIAE